jgi:hypothetical protein
LYAATSQLAWPDTAKNEVYSNNPSIYTKGADPISVASDGIFADGYEYQLATLTPNSTTGGYDSFLEVTVQGSGTSGVGYKEMQNAKQFILGQNFPNPYLGMTTIPVTLHHASDITIELFDLMGKKMTSIRQKGLVAGKHEFLVDTKTLGLPVGNYVYQLEVRNTSGTFRDAKLMTARI